LVSDTVAPDMMALVAVLVIVLVGVGALRPAVLVGVGGLFSMAGFLYRHRSR